MTLELMMQEREEKFLKQGMENVAKNLLSMGMSFEDICKATQLSIERIKELAKSIKK